MKNYDEKMVLNSHLVIKIEINRIRKNFVKSMSVKKFSYLGQFILSLRRSAGMTGMSIPPGCWVMMWNTFLSSLKHMWQHLFVTFDDLAKKIFSKFVNLGNSGKASNHTWTIFSHNKILFSIGCHALWTTLVPIASKKWAWQKVKVVLWWLGYEKHAIWSS